ncbi:MAG: hypothetical protein HKO67_14535 [Flavobacteriaceae bacterium]|nr:hypothetical protein [Flavobacteriaceae bacterium]
MRTNVFSFALFCLFCLFAVLMVACSTEEQVSNDILNTSIEAPVDNYYFNGQPPESRNDNLNVGVTKTIKFFESDGPFELDFTNELCTPAPYLSVYGYGNASHIGRYQVVNGGCYDGLSPILGVITAADGDEIHTYIASAVQDMLTGIWSYHYVIYNGTGRFENAYGDIYMTGTLDFNNWVWTLGGEGTITY